MSFAVAALDRAIEIRRPLISTAGAPIVVRSRLQASLLQEFCASRPQARLTGSLEDALRDEIHSVVPHTVGRIRMSGRPGCGLLEISLKRRARTSARDRAAADHILVTLSFIEHEGDGPPIGHTRLERHAVIAKRHRVSTTAVLRANGLSSSSTIYPGQVLVIPN